MKVIVVYNPHSGSTLSPRQLSEKFALSNIEIISFIDISQNFNTGIKPYIDQSDVIVVGYGGDGTLSTIASRLVGTKTIFAPLPGGTLNHFTKDLGINQDIDIAIHHLADAATIAVDTAVVNRHLFLNNSSIGLYPSSLSERSRIEKYMGKWPAAIVASIRALMRFKLYSITINGESFQTPFVFIGNNMYDIDNFMLRSSITKEVLNVYVVTSPKRSALLKILLYSAIGKRRMIQEIKSYRTDKLVIHINKPRVRVSLDGEQAYLAPPLYYEIKAKSLLVLV